MHSLKNTVVAVMLLGVTYGVYQVITTPDPTSVSDSSEMIDAIVEDFPEAASSIAQSINDKASDPGNPLDQIPRKLLDSAEDSMNNLGDAFDTNNRNHAPQLLSQGTPAKDELTNQSSDKQLIDSLRDQLGANNGAGFPANNTNPSNQEPLNRASRPSTEFQPSSEVTNAVGEFGKTVSNGIFDPNVVTTSSNAPIAFGTALSNVEQQVQNGEFRNALTALSRYYHDANLGGNDRSQMMDWLDHLAAKVIYSTEHHLRTTPYIIQPSDTITMLSHRWKVPAQLIYNVNRNKIPDPNALQPGVEIKMIGGPFNAEIDTQTKTMTLFLKGMYAGRFSIEPGSASQNGTPGEYAVVGKASNGKQFGPYWIGLSNGMCLHALSEFGSNKCFALPQKQAVEVFAILGKDSKIRLLR